MDSLILTIGAAAILIWSGMVLARGGLVGTALLLLLAGSCFGSPSFHVAAGPVQLTVDRLLLLVLLAQYAIYRHWGMIEVRPLSKADFLLGALVLVLVLSTLVHDYRADRWQPLAALLSFYVMPAVLYWIVRQAEWTARTAWCVLGSLAAFGVYLCLTAAAEAHGGWRFVVPRNIVSPAFGEFLSRGRGALLNPAATGLFETLGMCATLAFWPRVSGGGKLLVLVLLAVFLAGIYGTLTPSVWFGAAAALSVMVVLGAPQAWRVRVSAAAVLAATVVLALGWQHRQALTRDQLPSPAPLALSARPPTVPADVAWRMFLDRPILGCGLGQSGREMHAYLSAKSTQRPLKKTETYAQHNVLLGLLAETGLLGGGLFCALLVSWIVTASRLWRSSTAPSWVRQVGLVFLAWMAAYLASAMFHDPAIVPMVNLFLFFLGGSVMAVAAWLVRPQPRGGVKLWQPEVESELVAY